MYLNLVSTNLAQLIENHFFIVALVCKTAISALVFWALSGI